MTRMVMLGALVIIAVVGVFAGLSGERANAQTQSEWFLENDFKCYRAVGLDFHGERDTDIFIYDDLDGGKETTVLGVNALCNPADKDAGEAGVSVEGEPTSWDYFTCYEIDQEGFFFDEIEVDTDQFGSQDLLLKTADQFCARSYKSSDQILPGGPAGDELSVEGPLPQLKCYPAFQTDWEGWEPREIDLEDQYRETRALVLWPVSFCSPVKEWDFEEFSVTDSAGSEGEAAGSSEQGLVCYRIWEPGLEVNLAWTNNELAGGSDIVVLWAQTLCVPTRDD